MKRFLILGILAFGTGVFGLQTAQAQVVIRAPGVRVQFGGGGVGVRVPFLSYYAPPTYPPAYYYYQPPAYLPLTPPGEIEPPPTTLFAPAPRQPSPPIRNPDDDLAPPVPQTQVLTLEQFAKSFQAKAGTYEVEMLNPVTKRATPVRFSLPEGTPRRVDVNRRQVEFVYGPRQFVRIEFDKDGALVTSR